MYKKEGLRAPLRDWDQAPGEEDAAILSDDEVESAGEEVVCVTQLESM